MSDEGVRLEWYICDNLDRKERKAGVGRITQLGTVQIQPTKQVWKSLVKLDSQGAFFSIRHLLVSMCKGSIALLDSNEQPPKSLGCEPADFPCENYA